MSPQLLTEEYSVMSPGTMEVQGLTNQAEYDRIRALTKVSPGQAATVLHSVPRWPRRTLPGRSPASSPR